MVVREVECKEDVEYRAGEMVTGAKKVRFVVECMIVLESG